MTKHPETARMLALPVGTVRVFDPPLRVPARLFRERLANRLRNLAAARHYFWMARTIGNRVAVAKVCER